MRDVEPVASMGALGENLRSSRVVATLAVVVLAVFACACDDPLPGLGQACNVLCGAGLSCSARHVCVKSCHCDTPTPTCDPPNLASGCTPGATCVVTASDGEGVCVERCDPQTTTDAGVCPPGQATCAPGPDGIALCVGPDFGFWMPDLGGAD